jgi:hypothetical protein
MTTLPNYTEVAASRPDPATDHTSPGPAREGPESQGRGRGFLRRGWRKITWVMIAWGVLIAVGCLLAFGSGGHAISECQKIGGSLGGVCQEAVTSKIESKVQHLLKIGVLGFLVLAAVWTMSRPKD